MLTSSLVGNPESSEEHAIVHRMGKMVGLEGTPVFGSDVLLECGQDSVKQVHERMGQGRPWRVALQSARSLVEEARQISCPVGDVQNAAVHREDDDSGLGRGRGRCLDG
ncbi:MAG: hypothetical protein ACXW39_06375 [Nitrospira sp.]